MIMKIIVDAIIRTLILLLFIFFGSMDIAFIIVTSPSFKKTVNQRQNRIYKRSIEYRKKAEDIVLDVVTQLMVLISGGAVVFFVISVIPNELIQVSFEWYLGVCIASIIPTIYTLINEKQINSKVNLKVTLVIYTVISSVLCYIFGKDIAKNRLLINGVLTILVILFLQVLIDIYIESKRYYSKKVPKKGVRKDLYRRIPILEIDISSTKLIKGCEKYYTEYMYRYNKIKRIDMIKYINLSGQYRKEYGLKAVQLLYILVRIGIAIGLVALLWGGMYKWVLVLFFVSEMFVIEMEWNKYKDAEYLYKILIRLVYHEWGYYLTYSNKNKFVGTVQMIELSKYHKYVHSFLDIVALCRAVAINDQLEGRNRMSIITSNLSELFEDYSDDGDCKQDRNWVTLIPLWAATLFEFSVTGTVNADAKPVLLEYADASARFDISMFLQSFWADMERRELSDGVAEFVQAFERELYTVDA